MKRDMNLIRKILEYASEQGNGEPLEAPICPGHDATVIHYHIGLCEQAGFFDVYVVSHPDETNKRYAIGSMTWAGHDELERLR